MVAVNQDTGAVEWDTPLPSSPYGAATVTNDVVFTTTFHGDLYALDVGTGKILLTTPLSAGTNAPVAVDGDYVIAGAGASLAPSQQRMIIAYKLGATGKLPDTVGSLAAWRDDIHVAAPSRAVAQLAVGGHQAAAARLGERQVGGVIGRHVVTQFPHPPGQLIPGRVADRELVQGAHGRAGALVAELASQPPAPDRRRDLHPQVFRGRPVRVNRQLGLGGIPGRAVVGQGVHHERRVNDDHASPVFR